MWIPTGGIGEPGVVTISTSRQMAFGRLRSVCFLTRVFGKLKKMSAYASREIIRIESWESKMRKPWLGFSSYCASLRSKQNEVFEKFISGLSK